MTGAAVFGKPEAGNVPTASQMLGYTVLDYAQAGKMGDITDVAKKEG